ncbi:MAG TPA: N-acetylmuramoyl-L-alanine amidase [Verrucomicrobiae bacterium]|nr:N-acetylmuramoyl-L-alanine amidase [Verrucomicrobiae bacterium]
MSALLLVAGCVSSPVKHDPNKPLPENWDSDLGHQPRAEPEIPLPSRPQPQQTQSTSAPPVFSQPPVTPTATNIAAPKPPAPLTTAESGMVSLNRWATQNGLRDLRTIPLSPSPAYAVVTSRGNFAVQVGKLAAFWDGLEVRLGFPPQQIGDQIFLNALDIKKVLEPLAHGTPLVTRSNRLVVLDPGHGASNLGTRSTADGRYEKELTLDWARRLAPLLERNGWRVLLTRTNDVEMSLAERTAFAEANRADLFLSLHFNSSGGISEPAGVETYCLTPTGMPSSVTRGYTDDVREVYPNNAFDAANLQYAVRLHRAMLSVSGTADRGVRRARYQTVLCGQNRPAVLIEAGYLSNPSEAKRIANPEYRQKLAEAIAKALP